LVVVKEEEREKEKRNKTKTKNRTLLEGRELEGATEREVVIGQRGGRSDGRL